MAVRAAPRILITGSPGSGKSTLMRRLIEHLQDHRIAGLSTPEVRRAGIRQGFKMIDLASGEEQVLASIAGKGPAVGKYRVNVAGIDEIVRKMESSLPTADYIFIDEIGKMELFSKSFEALVQRVFSLDKPIVAVVHRNFVPRYRNKGKLFVVNRENFRDVLEKILALMNATRS